MTVVGSGARIPRLLSSASFHSRLAVEMTGLMGSDEDRRDERDKVLTLLQSNRFGVGSAAHNTALGRRALCREVFGDRMKSMTLRVASGSVLAIGLGNPSALFEMGFTLDRTLGVPYLPGSAIRGATRSFAKLESQGAEADAFFGTPDCAGTVAVFDALPNIDVTVCTEVITPHFAEWYTNGEAPGEWYSPVPVEFLVVTGGSFSVDLLDTLVGLDRPDLESAAELVANGLFDLGIGGKTSSGFGVIERNS